MINNYILKAIVFFVLMISYYSSLSQLYISNLSVEENQNIHISITNLGGDVELFFENNDTNRIKCQISDSGKLTYYMYSKENIILNNIRGSYCKKDIRIYNEVVPKFKKLYRFKKNDTLLFCIKNEYKIKRKKYKVMIKYFVGGEEFIINIKFKLKKGNIYKENIRITPPNYLLYED